MIAVAIDGPAGAGKSSIAKHLAKKLGYVYVDTGALYRAIGLRAVRLNTPWRDEAAIAEMLRDTEVDLRFEDGAQSVFLNGENVNGLIRTQEVSMAASAVSSLPCVRAFLLEQQRAIARANNVIMDGRDISTVVLPDAQVKIFLTASCEERARRRFDQLAEKGETPDYEQLLEEIRQRDSDDSTRDICPLKPAPDSDVVDTTGETLEQSTDRIEHIIKERIKSAV